MVHLYELNGYHIAIDQNSGCVHALDRATYAVLSHFDENGAFDESARGGLLRDEALTEADLEEILEEIAELKKSGQLFSEIAELKKSGQLFSEDLFKPLAQGFKQRQSVLKAMCLHVAHACNMDCEYCFAGKGEYHGKAGLMSLETGKKAIDFLVENSPGRRNLEVDFFGGEPLLNWEVCKELVRYGRSLEASTGKNFRFTLTTNGILVDQDVIDFCNKEMGNVVLSLDGCKETNDRMRHLKGSEKDNSAYEKIVPKFKAFADARDQKDYYMRGTYTKWDLHFADEILHMADLGFKELSMEPVVAPMSAPYALHDEDAEVLCQEYEKLSLAMLERKKEGRPFNFYHYDIDLMGGPCISKRISGCGVGTEYVAVTPEGDIYPGITNPDVHEEFTGCNVYSHKECEDCFARLYCSGGCAANAYHTTGTVTGVYDLGCVLHRKRIECAVMMKVAEAMEEGE